MKFEELAVGPAPQLGIETYRARRRKLARQLGEGNALVVATHTAKQYSNDVDYAFRPHSDFWYLTGFAEPGATLVLQGGTGHSTLFLRDRRKEAEIWTGRRLGVERAVDALDIDQAHPTEEMTSRLPDVLGKARVHAITDHDPAVRRRVVKAAGRKWVADPGPHRPGGPEKGAKVTKAVKKEPHGRQLLHNLRLIKDADEIRMIQRACDLGVDAHLRAAAEIRPGAQEYQVEAAFGQHARHHGSTGCGYPSICGCGANAAVLHYISNLSGLERGKLFLIDAGCEWGYYTSDITRTYPIGGKFSRLQQQLYELVLLAHEAAMAKVAPGNLFKAPHEAAAETLTAGLIEMNLLKGPFETAMREKTYRSFFMHGTSHFLGLDVHDAGDYNGPDGKPRKIKEGMVLTIEPGLYFNPDFATCPPETVGIGIRIEDDVVVTESGRRNMTRRLPTDPEAVAALLR